MIRVLCAASAALAALAAVTAQAQTPVRAGTTTLCQVQERCLQPAGTEYADRICTSPTREDADASLRLSFDAEARTGRLVLPGGDRLAATPGDLDLEGPLEGASAPHDPLRSSSFFDPGPADEGPLMLLFSSIPGAPDDAVGFAVIIVDETVRLEFQNPAGSVHYAAVCEGMS